MESIAIRPLAGEDVPFLFSLTSDPAVSRFMRFDTHQHEGQAQELFEEYTTQGSKGFLAYLQPSGIPIGAAAIKAPNPDPAGGCIKEANLSFFLSASHWNKGYGSQMLLLLEKQAEKMGADLLRAYVVGDNTGSKKILEKRGFSVEEIRYYEDLPCGLFIYALRISC